MGALRFVLALSVVLWHVDGIAGHMLIAGDVAVQTFYVISGFFMSMVLSEKYVGTGALRLFYGNRLLRIFGIYLPVLILTVGVHLAVPAGGQQAYLLWHPSLWPRFSLPTAALLVWGNLFIVGQDLCLFLSMAPTGQIYFAPDPVSDPPLFLFFVVPPAWSLAVELAFYSIAPFILRRRLGLVLSVFALSLTARLIAARYDLRDFPWSYGFFPFEIASFLLGAISYRLWVAIRDSRIQERWPFVGTVALALAVVMLASVAGEKQYFLAWRLTCYLAVVLLLPIIHAYTRLDPFDQMLGKLSYPLYLCHLTVIYICDRVAAMLRVMPAHALSALLDVALSIGAAALLVRFVEVPLDRYRHHRLASSRQRYEAVPIAAGSQ